MQTFLPLLLKSALISGLLYLYYSLFLKGKKLHKYNRYYLLTAVMISLAVPFMNFQWYSIQQEASPAVKLLEVINRPDVVEPILPGETSLFTIDNIAGYGYWLVSLFLLVALVVRIVWVVKLKTKANILKVGSVDVIETTSSAAPFSFMGTVYWRKGLPIDGDEGQLILRHELCHIDQKHTVDKLFLQIVLIAAWVNPVFWLISKELSLQHEFIADEAALEGKDTDAFARMILQAQYGNLFPDIVHPFFHSSIKRRLMMLNQTNKTRFSFMRRLMVIPVIAGVVFLLSFKLRSDDTHVYGSEVSVNKSEKKIAVVFDAGHGGRDPGASGINGIKEKDLTLRICKKLALLAGEYNIDAKLTREDDAYPTLQERVDVTLKENPALFVCIHVNANAKNAPEKGYELVVSDKNSQFEESKLFASTVSARLATQNIKVPLIQRGLLVLKEANRPAIALECGNIDNQNHMAMLTNEKSLERFCRNILSGIVDYQNSIK